MKVLLTPLLHPAAIVRGRWNMEPAMQRYLQRVKDNPFPTPLDLSQAPGPAILYPTLSDLDAFGAEARRLKAVALDIETGGPALLCVGFAAMTPPGEEPATVGLKLCLRFRRQGGRLYWSDWPSHEAATQWLYDLLADATVDKVFHNGIAFDVPYLEELGFTVAGQLWDTILMAHAAYSELPKRLQFLSTLFLGFPVWKTMVKDEAIEEKG